MSKSLKNCLSQSDLAAIALLHKLKNPAQYQQTRLDKKLKALKYSLKKAENHNEQLHLKIKNLKENNQVELIHLESQYSKYKNLYEVLLEKYDNMSAELQLSNKKVKKLEKKLNSKKTIESWQEIQQEIDSIDRLKSYRDTITKNQVKVEHLKHQNVILCDDILQKSKKIKQLEGYIVKHCSKDKTVSKSSNQLLTNLKNALQSKSEQFDKLIFEKTKLIENQQTFNQNRQNLVTKIENLQHQINKKQKMNQQLQQRLKSIQQQKANINTKYNEFLTYNYDLQKDFEKQLHIMAKELTKRQMKKNNV